MSGPGYHRGSGQTSNAHDLRSARFLWDYLRLGIPSGPPSACSTVASRRKPSPWNASPNTIENFRLSTELLRDLGLNPATFEEDLAGDIPAAARTLQAAGFDSRSTGTAPLPRQEPTLRGLHVYQSVSLKSAAAGEPSDSSSRIAVSCGSSPYGSAYSPVSSAKCRARGT